MPAASVIIHERIGRWARHLKPRLRASAPAVRWSETRSELALVREAARSPCPIVVVDLDGRVGPGLDDLLSLRRASPDALALVLDPTDRPEVAAIARELGATLVLGGVVVPPVVEALLLRWLPLAARRGEAAGWWPAGEPDLEFWERAEPALASNEPNPPGSTPAVPSPR